ncbi:protein TolR [Pararhodobacter oceanensis]|uniref:Protein TolR n=1 Tax=Pararhodobacter oceanensis TaxID=2172121 RepID=A0A2T8HUL9_9RHOB|nr:protein TolR [Pararhodobacter oceanensis]PVH29042.1 protein TolR [Pararhodobacter oceanensis]
MGAQAIRRQSGSGTRRRRRGQAKRMSEINVTPFVDVMLVLLIIFMVAAPMLTVGVPVELPESAAGALAAEQEEPLAITLTADGQLLLQTTEIAANELLPRLQAIAAERQDTRIFLRADGAIPYARVAELMGALNAGGFRNIGLVTETGGPTFGAGTDQ